MRSDWLRCQKPRPEPSVRMICAAHSGGAASMFGKWHEHLPENIEVWAVQSPGREDRFTDPPVGSIDAIVDAIGPDVMTLGRDAELVLLGNCLGALVMYELTRWLRDRGALDPRLLVVAAHPAPPLTDPPADPPFHQRPDAELVREVGKWAGVDPELTRDPEIQELLVPAFRADAQAHETYRHRPGEPFSCDILTVGGLDDADVPQDALRAWSGETLGNFTLRMFTGGHLFMLTEYAGLLSLICQLLAIE